MRHFRLLAFLFLCVAICMPGPGFAQSGDVARVLTIEGALTPAMGEYLERGLERANQDSVPFLIVQLDTPGGSVDVMTRMVQAIRGSDVPVIVYIAPRGAAAGSAGTVITLAGHVAAMAPETVIGAASPVGLQGEDLDETLEVKTMEILKATVRTLAGWRGEDAVLLAEETIELGRAASAEEALDVGLVDFIAEDLTDLLAQMDGFTVMMPDGQRQLNTAGVSLLPLEQSAIERVLQVLTNPNITFLLLTIGVQALLIELSHPGGWVAGFLGVASLALGAYGLGILPVNWFGLVFMLVSFVLFFLEVKAPTHGALTIVGLGAFIAGSLVLFNSPGTPSFQRVSIPLVVGTSLATAAFFLTIVAFAIRAQLQPVRTGIEAMMGKTGTVTVDLDPVGAVQIAGEQWSAEVEGNEFPLQAGQRIRVTGRDGLRLKVSPIQEAG